MLLELLHAQSEGREMTVSDVCERSGAPESVAIRWLKTLVDEGLVLRRGDPPNTGNERVELTPDAKSAFTRYFHDLSEHSRTAKTG